MPGAVAAAGLVALAVAMGIGRFAFTPILPMMQQEHGLTVAEGGWLASANYAGYLLGALSAMAPRARPAAGIRAGLVLIAVVTIGMGIEQTFSMWLGLRALAGIGSAWVLVFASAWSLERLAAVRRPLLNGLVFAGVGTGIAVAGAWCLGLMQAGGGAAQAWLGLGLVSLAATAAIWPIFGRAGTGRPGRRDDAVAPVARHGPSGAAGAGRSWNADAVRLVLCYGAYGFGYIIPGTFLPAMARQLVADPLVFGWSWPLFGVAAAVTPLGAAALGRRWGNRRVWIASHLVMALGVAVPLAWPGIGGIMAAALLVGGPFVVVTLVGMQEARSVAGAAAPRLMAAMTSAFALGQILGPICVSLLVGAGADLSRPLLIASAVLVAGAIGLAARSRRGPDALRELTLPRTGTAGGAGSSR
jgi:MFS family permease